MLGEGGVDGHRTDEVAEEEVAVDGDGDGEEGGKATPSSPPVDIASVSSEEDVLTVSVIAC